jgi:catechol 2,3-dioxygenase
MGMQWPLGAVSLKVLNLGAEKAFYARLGLIELGSEGRETVMGVEGRALVRLWEMDGRGRQRPPWSAGLFRLGLRLGSETALGNFLWRMVEAKLNWLGSGHDNFSQSFYFQSPEGNGVEVYAEQEWPEGTGPVEVLGGQLVVDQLLAKGERAAAGKGLGAQTVVGHLELNVGDLDRSQKFYSKLGMKVRGAKKDMRMRYLSWNGDHYHLAINTLEGRGVSKVQGNMSGIEGFECTLVQGKHVDPDGIVVGSKMEPWSVRIS